MQTSEEELAPLAVSTVAVKLEHRRRRKRSGSAAEMALVGALARPIHVPPLALPRLRLQTESQRLLLTLAVPLQKMSRNAFRRHWRSYLQPVAWWQAF